MTPLNGMEKAQIADFVHGADGFGNTGQLPAKVPLVLKPLSKTRKPCFTWNP